ncbi:hypothetical protein CVT25_002674 [Psilocybe cyanescens]|uniref:tRNA (guanine(37)-N1)-methyltransferase n=1 Tax=Psilocybe cyanescens TaxID=93625 RepID=A0A409WLK4_PSICY|nr:hypothetical protein CVT25_002674 [Psilocybe cyanescens]
MSRHLYLDSSPPPYTGPKDHLDREAFRKKLSVLGARVPPERTRVLLKANELKSCLMDLPKIRTVVSDPSQPDGDRLVLLRMSTKADIPQQAQEFLDKESKGLVDYKIQLNYDYWTAEECLQVFLPEDLREGAPTGFAMTGHIAHVNLNDEYLPYKHVIGQLILDKNKRVETVVNKLDSIDTKFRFFKMELIAGRPDYVVEHHEADCKFTFDFTEVYWNSRLHTEHERLVQLFKPEEIIADAFAGVGPFAVPAAKKGCAVLGNDLNPNSAKYLLKNVQDNRVTDLVRVSCEDGRDFIRTSVALVFDNPFPAYTGPKPSRVQEERERKRLHKLAAEGHPISPPTPVDSTLPPRQKISHFVMNLPDSALTFLDAFRGILIDDKGRNLSGVYDEMPMVHCHCFTRELDPAMAEKDIRQRAEEKLGYPLTAETRFHLVRSVAPNKEMYTPPHIILYPIAFTAIMASWTHIFPTVHCESDGPSSITKSALQSVRTAVAVPESEIKRWRRTFDTNAKVINGEKFLDADGFIDAIAPAGDLSKIGRAQFGILFRIADTSRRGLISWDDFTVFETLLKRPDADYWMAFQYFDVDHSGYIDYNEFKTVFSANLGPDAIPFDFDCDWIKLYLGKKNGSHVLGYNEFTQLMKGLQGERLRQAFKYLDTDQDGFIRPEEFKRIILAICIDISLQRIIREATAKSKDGRIDQADFLNHAASSSRYSLFTPMEASIVFHFASRGLASQRLALIDFAQLLDPRWRPPHEEFIETKPVKVSLAQNFLHSSYSFVQGGFAGAVGATIVYPIDMVVGQLLYKNSIDCAKKIFRNEGFVGFYRGLGPQLVGVAPEKAIKLTVNDLVRSRAMDPETGRIALGWELMAGGLAGGSQVVFTNPLEIVKIRLQVQGEAAKVEGAVPKGAVHIIRQLGILGLYKGSTACLLRDIPFSAIYFTAYSHLKKDVFQEGYNDKRLSFLETLAAAGIAGMPAAYLTTPADVVKTRLQVEARKGQTNYSGLRDAFVKIYREEGFRALFKGGPARVIRSSPQFGFTLLAYETLKDVLPYPWADKPIKMETALTARPDEMSKVRARNALKILLDVHGDFGHRAAAFSGKPLSLSNPRLSS